MNIHQILTNKNITIDNCTHEKEKTLMNQFRTQYVFLYGLLALSSTTILPLY